MPTIYVDPSLEITKYEIIETPVWYIFINEYAFRSQTTESYKFHQIFVVNTTNDVDFMVEVPCPLLVVDEKSLGSDFSSVWKNSL